MAFFYEGAHSTSLGEEERYVCKLTSAGTSQVLLQVLNLPGLRVILNNFLSLSRRSWSQKYCAANLFLHELSLLESPSKIFTAFDCSFEFSCISKYPRHRATSVCDFLDIKIQGVRNSWKNETMIGWDPHLFSTYSWISLVRTTWNRPLSIILSGWTAKCKALQ